MVIVIIVKVVKVVVVFVEVVMVVVVAMELFVISFFYITMFVVSVFFIKTHVTNIRTFMFLTVKLKTVKRICLKRQVSFFVTVVTFLTRDIYRSTSLP